MSHDAETLWLGVEPRHLATFAAVAEAGSFRRAAAELGYVQSAVSQQVVQLERTLETVLIDRGRKSGELRLTPAGRALLAHARRVVGQIRAACADVRFLAGDGTLRLGVEPAATALVPGIARRLDTLGIRGQLSVLALPATQQIECVITGAIDLAIGGFDQVPPALSRSVVDVDRWVLIAPEGTEDATAALRDMPLIRDRTHPWPRSTRPLGSGATIDCDGLTVALALVRAGAGGAIVPEGATAGLGHGLVVVELGDVLPPRPRAAIWLRERRLPHLVDALGLGSGGPAGPAVVELAAAA